MNSGYAIHGHELLKRLHKDSRFDIAELGTDAQYNDSRIKNIPWRYYNNMPADYQKNELAKQQISRWGQYSFTKVFLDFKPDFVIDLRDWWTSEWLSRHPARRYFNLVLSPSIDSPQQRRQWLDTYNNADLFFVHTHFANRAMLEYGLEPHGVSSLCASEDFHPLPTSKSNIKQMLGFPKDYDVIGSVMRNQPRKLYDMLFDFFKLYLAKNPKTYLYIHCEVNEGGGWNLCEMAHSRGIQQNVYAGYFCNVCKKMYVDVLREGLSICPYCQECRGQNPTSIHGVSQKALNYVYNAMDVYLQYARNEGTGISPIEATYAGVQSAAPYFSGMEHVMDATDGIKLTELTYYEEFESGRTLCLPNNQEVVDKIGEYLRKPEELRYAECIEKANKVRGVLNWDKTIKVMIDAIAATPIKNVSRRRLNTNLPALDETVMRLDNQSFIRFLFRYIVQDTSYINSYTEKRLIKALNEGRWTGGFDGFLWHEMFRVKRESQSTYRDCDKEVLYNNAVACLSEILDFEEKYV